MGRHENRIASLSRADPELRAAAESVLKDGEGLSSLIEDSVRRQIDYGKIQAEFIARGLPGLAEAERTGIHHTTATVIVLAVRHHREETTTD
jgi:hypothetical protein